MSEKTKLYQVLGVQEGSEAGDLKRAYKMLLKKYHPDTGITPNRYLLERVVNAYRTITAAPDPCVKPKRTLKNLDSIFIKETSLDLKLSTVKDLSNSGKKRSYFYLRKGLYDSDEKVVCASVEAVGKLGLMQSAPEFLAIFRIGSKKVKISVLNAIEDIGTYTVFHDIIDSALHDPDIKVRQKLKSILSKKR